ncbi:MAG TPA: ComF family protein [Dehalococcoidia bacterium]|nr:ComF family protein [Dehalococcoidia bacterium]
MTSLRVLLRRAASLTLDELLPPRCALCAAYGAFLCAGCRDDLPVAGDDRCAICWQMVAAPLCPRCAEYGAGLTAVRAPFRYERGAQRLVTSVKYGGRFALVGPMAELLAVVWPSYGLAASAVVPVPLHRRRERSRGFNQAALLARGLGTRLGLPVRDDVLVRVRSTPAQVRTASAAERRQNVYGAFACRAEVADSALLLVDDVVTTGATFAACAEPLFAAGAAAVYGLAFATAG